MKVFLVDAFTDKKFEGNRAGVVFDTGTLTAVQKQALASEIGASETAFVSASPNADYKLDFYTPKSPIDFCGHATVAASYMLAKLGRLSFDSGLRKVVHETKAGLVPVSIELRDEMIQVSMSLRKPQFASVPFSAGEIAQALNLSLAELDATYPLGLANAGNWHLMVGVSCRGILDRIVYDSAALSQILLDLNAVTVHVFCVGPNAAPGRKTFHARNFCPTIGIPEDPATGSAAGAFGAYLAEGGKLETGLNEITIFQGEAMGRPSRIHLSVKTLNGRAEELTVAGTAALSFTLLSEEESELLTKSPAQAATHS